MKRPLSIVGCGLLVLALSSFGVGCKSKSKGVPDSGTDASTSTGGSSGGGSGGSGGKGGSGGGGGAGALTTMECTMMTAKAGVAMACASCVCTKNVMQASACIKDANCWKLIQCVGSMCTGASDLACIGTKCMAFTGGATPATPLGMTITSMCATECATPKSNDGGTDAH